MADATMVQVFEYLSDNKTSDYKLTQFRADWAELSDKDKADLKRGIGDGTLTY